uniref:Anaphylatoxin-like domain-containing protein n=1 Tax=Poecilia mexicana TaxID=48701 RepID=A0A3B3X3F7_9TELE
MASLSDSFLITAPLSVCLDAVETVFVQLFGSSTEETVYVFLKTSMARDHRELSKDSLRLNSQNNYQGVAKLLPLPENKNLNHVILHVQSNGINRHLSIPVSRSNGFLFIQTDKPLYTPHQKVKVRAFSMNQELRPANRSVFLTFKDPDHITVDVVEIVDVNNGIPSMQNPFRIPIKPKLGIWTIEASYTDDFTTKAKTDFEVKEYVLPSFSIQMNPQTNFISHSQFSQFHFKISVFLHISQHGVRLSPSLSPPLLTVWTGCRPPGGITQEAEFATVKFVRSPYRLSLISTPPFIKPGLPYKIQVCIMESHLKSFETADPTLPAQSQASLALEAVAYHSPNQRYLYIDTPMFGHTLQVSHYANIQVLSKGKVVFFKSQNFASSVDGKQNLNFLVTTSMVPSIRLLVYYILDGEGTTELVADSVWMDVKDKCVNGLQVLNSSEILYKPKENIKLDIRTNQGSMVALSAVDSAVLSLRPNYRDPVSMVLRHFEHSDLGCGGGGGKDNADVFRLAGLTFMTNANAAPSSTRTFGSKKSCCLAGMKYIPKSVSCQQYADQAFQKLRIKNEPCKAAFSQCCKFYQQHLDQGDRLVLGRYGESGRFWSAPSPSACLQRAVGLLSMCRSVQTVAVPSVACRINLTAESVWFSGMCVSDPVKVSVNQPLSVDVPLPYQVVRGEQLELQGSVYNQQDDIITYCVTLTAGPAFCLLKSRPTPRQEGHHTTACTWSRLAAGGVGKVTFTLLGLEPGEHTLTFTLTIQSGVKDVVKKTLRVVPEGVRQEVNSGGRLDPQGLYGLWTPSWFTSNPRHHHLVSVILDPEGLKRLLSLPPGSAAAEVDRLLPLIQVYQYLETNSIWDVLGENVEKNSGQVGLTSFRNGDSSYSMWMNSEPSTLTLSLADPFVSVDHQSLSDSVSWLIRKTQQPDGSFMERASSKNSRLMVSGVGLLWPPLASFVLLWPLLSSSGLLCPPLRAVCLQLLSLPVEGGVSAAPLSACRGRYCLSNLVCLFKGRIHYANPVVSWLTQDQHYGEGFYSIKDMVLTLEALTEYSKVVPKAVLNQDIRIRNSRQEELSQVQLSRSHPVAPPLQVRPSPPGGMKTVYYQTTASTQTSCNFDLTIELVGPGVSSSTSSSWPSPPQLDLRKLCLIFPPHALALPLRSNHAGSSPGRLREVRR